MAMISVRKMANTRIPLAIIKPFAVIRMNMESTPTASTAKNMGIKHSQNFVTAFPSG
jgi:hypothetical protein